MWRTIAAIGDERWRIGNGLAVGGGLGIDIPVAKNRWSVSLTAKYLDTSVDSVNFGHDRFESSFDPLMPGVGFGFDF